MGELTCLQLASYNFFLLHNNQSILHNLESITVFVFVIFSTVQSIVGLLFDEGSRGCNRCDRSEEGGFRIQSRHGVPS